MKTAPTLITLALLASTVTLAQTIPTVPAISEALRSPAIATATSAEIAASAPAITAPISSNASACDPTLAPCGVVAAVATAPRPRPMHSHVVSRAEREFDSRQRSEIAEHIAISSQAPSTAYAHGSATSYKYQDGEIFIVYAGLERVTSIDLEPGEEVTGAIQGGDTVRWNLATVTSGTGATAQQHVIVKPTEAGIITNMLIPTNRRVYMLDLRAVSDWYMPSVRFTYPAEEWTRQAAALQAQATREEVAEPVSMAPEALHFDYRISGREYAWRPMQVFDDGVKTYLRMPASLRSTEAPALFVIERGEPLLVNYRIKGTSDSDSAGVTYIVDRVFDRAELRVGTHQTLTIRRR